MYVIVARMSLVVSLLVVVGLLTIVGPDRIRQFLNTWRERVRVGGPALVLLLVVLAINSVARQAVPDISWIIGVEITDTLYQIEGAFVAWLQSFEHTTLTVYFSFIYIYGYVFLLVFPIVAYAMLDRMDSFRTLVWAYLLNYSLGLICYTIFIAFGPRNVLPELVEGLLYTSFPEYQLLTREVNRNTNVFPSLHTSLSVTVLLLAVRTRDSYPRWLPVAALLSVSVLVSTMYLGIHWATDVLAGIVLAWVCVRLAERIVDRERPRFSVRLPFSRTST